VPTTRVLYKTQFVISGYQTREDEQREREQARQRREERAAARRSSGE